MATVTKKSHSIDSDAYSAIERIAKDEGVTPSALLTEGAFMVILRRQGLAAVAKWERENGALTAEELATADAALDSVGIGS